MFIYFNSGYNGLPEEKYLKAITGVSAHREGSFHHPYFKREPLRLDYIAIFG